MSTQHTTTATEISDVSPDGIPAHPSYSAGRIGVFVVATMMLIMLIAVLIAAYVSAAFGVAIGVIGFASFVLNPAVWASVFRAKERAEIEHN